MKINDSAYIQENLNGVKNKCKFSRSQHWRGKKGGSEKPTNCVEIHEFPVFIYMLCLFMVYIVIYVGK